MQHTVVTQQDWIAAQAAFLEQEKEFTRQRDELARRRRELPWMRVEKDYWFDSVDGRISLAELFAGKSQLFVQHFMFAPGATAACPGCSFLADHMNAARVHFTQRDVNFVAVSRAPLGELLGFRKRMGWTFPWVSSGGSDFNYDFGVSFKPAQVEAKETGYNFGTGTADAEDLPGTSVFYKDDAGQIYRTYSSFGRGGEMMISTYMALDTLPKGRNEDGFKYHPMEWVRLHDEYEAQTPKGRCCD